MKKTVKKKQAQKKRNTSRASSSEVPSKTFQSAKASAYGDDLPICKNAKCKLRKESCKGFIACPGFKS